MVAVLQHELCNAFNTLTVYLFCTALLCFDGMDAAIQNIRASVTNFEYVPNFVSPGFTVIIPALTMRSFAEGRNQKTDQYLYFSPLKVWRIVQIVPFPFHYASAVGRMAPCSHYFG